MNDDIAAKIAELEALDIQELKTLWGDILDVARPRRTSRQHLINSVAYRLQAQAEGGLRPAVRRRLLKLAVAFDRDPGYIPADAPKLKPGTRLVREWRGEMHAVTVLDRGYAYRDERFDSLSVIARTITGTRWSGPLFFGLKKRDSQDREAHHGH